MLDGASEPSKEEESESDVTSMTDISVSVSLGMSASVISVCSCDDCRVDDCSWYKGLAKASLMRGKKVKSSICVEVHSLGCEWSGSWALMVSRSHQRAGQSKAR